MTSDGNSFSDSLQSQITKFRRTALPVIFTLRHLKKKSIPHQRFPGRILLPPANGVDALVHQHEFYTSVCKL